VEGGSLAPLQLRRSLSRFGELSLHLPRPVENAPRHVERHTGPVAKFLGEVEHHVIGSLGRGVERLLRAVALLGRRLLGLHCPVAFFLRELLLLDGDGALCDCDTPLPVCDAGEAEGQHEAGAEIARENVAPTRRRLTTAPYEAL